MVTTILNGITWGHSRGITPLLAVSQRYAELHPGVDIRWVKRSLQEFADFPIEKLTEKYDLLIIDHPWVGCAAATNCVLPLDKWLSEAYLEEQAENSVGLSHPSYFYEGHQWALAVDAATPAASYRKDLLESNNAELPATWQDVVAMAKKGRVAVPGIPIDLLMNFYTFCIAVGSAPFQNDSIVVDDATGILALETMRELYSHVDEGMFKLNPIGVAELMSSTDNHWYCPFAYGYSNYSRRGYAKYLLHYADVVSFDEKQLRTTIGGTGVAVSAFSNYKDIAVDFAALVASEACQQTIYVQNGGQPGHLLAWKNDMANQLTHNFFERVLPVMKNGYMRPRYNGYLFFQDHGGIFVQSYLRGNISGAHAMTELNKLYQQSFVQHKTTVAV